MRRTRVIVVVATSFFGLLVDGFTGGALGATAGWIATDEQAYRRRFLAGLTIALVVIAALGTVLEASNAADDLGPDYANQRELAGLATRTAVVFIVAITTRAALLQRAPTQATALAPPPAAAGDRMTMLVAATAGLGSALVRNFVGPEPISPLYAEVAATIDLGVDFGRGGGFDAPTTALVTPVAPALAAFWPFGADAATVVFGAVLAACIVMLASAHGRAVALVTAALVVVLPAVWGQQLPATVATAAVVVAWLALDPRRPSPLVVLAGVALAIAALTRPEVILAVPVFVLWLAKRQRRRAAVALLLCVMVCVAPWHLWVHRNFDTWWPTTSVGPILAASSSDDARGGADIGALAGHQNPEPGSEAAAQRAGLDDALDQSLAGLDPRVVAARALRAWDVWDPANSAEMRERRSLPFPGGTTGAVASAAVALVALAGGLRRSQPRGQLPYVAMPVAATVGVVLTFGDRALVAWAIPAVLISASRTLVDAARAMQERRGSARDRASRVASGSEA